jgi:hypothetical protein
MNVQDIIKQSINPDKAVMEFSGAAEIRLYSEEDGCVIGYYTVDFEPALQATFFSLMEHLTAKFKHLAILVLPKSEQSSHEPWLVCSNQRWSPFPSDIVKSIEDTDIQCVTKNALFYDLNRVPRQELLQAISGSFFGVETTFAKIVEMTFKHNSLLIEAAKQRAAIQQGTQMHVGNPQAVNLRSLW